MIPRTTMKVKVIGQTSRSPAKKTLFYVSFYNLVSDVFIVNGQDGSRSKVTGVMILVDGLTSMSSCIFYILVLVASYMYNMHM